MHFIWVWVLIAVSDSMYNRGTVTLMDNIATKASCEVIRANIERVGFTDARCVYIQKVVTQ